jgi:hypothetical protein
MVGSQRTRKACGRRAGRRTRGGVEGAPAAPVALGQENPGSPEPPVAARGSGLGYCGVLVAGDAVGVATAGTGAAGIGVALETEWPGAWAYLARSSRISDW